MLLFEAVALGSSCVWNRISKLPSLLFLPFPVQHLRRNTSEWEQAPSSFKFFQLHLYRLDWHAINSSGIFKNLFLSERGWQPSKDSDSVGKNNPCSAEEDRMAGRIARQWFCVITKGAHCFQKADQEKILALNQGFFGHWFITSTDIFWASWSLDGGLRTWASQGNWLHLCL